MRIIHAEGVEGARAAEGVAVVIDVLRAFTTSAYALAHGARECLLVGTVEEALEIRERVPEAVLSAEVDGQPVPGIPLSNSPTMVAQVPVSGRVLVQRTTSGVQAALAAGHCEHVLAAAFVVAGATVRSLRSLQAKVVTLVATGAPLGHLEDRACADLLEALLEGRPAPGMDSLLAPLRRTDRYRRLAAGLQPGFPPTDLNLALDLDTFGFAMPVQPVAGGSARIRALPEAPP